MKPIACSPASALPALLLLVAQYGQRSLSETRAAPPGLIVVGTDSAGAALAPPSGTNPVAAPPPASHIYRAFGERKLQLAMHYPPGWKPGDRRTAILFFSGSHKVQPDQQG